MEFTLTYRGPLKANGGAVAKQFIRRAVHAQMKELWQQLPLASYREFITDPPDPNKAYLINQVGLFRFAPLVASQLALVAELAITMLRPEPPGAIVSQGGDIDNRLKTLLDALRMPKVQSELPVGDVPLLGEDPYFCLLEDDALITKLSVDTDRLLEPVQGPTEVQLLIRVHTKVVVGTFNNLGLG